MNPHKVIIATRGSQLALWQSEHVRTLLRSHHPELDVELEVITTQGDAILDRPLAEIGDKGLFTAELQQALVDKRCDIAVHSLKDMETTSAEGLDLLAILKREDPRDVLLVRKGVELASSQHGLASLPKGARLGTGSLRRHAQAQALRPDLTFSDLRGNVGTRIEKLTSGEHDAIILAAAGLLRLELVAPGSLEPLGNLRDRGVLALALQAPGWLYASSQGAIGVEGRADDDRLRTLLAPLNDDDSWVACQAERAFLRTVEGGCKVPVGAHARFVGPDSLELKVGIFALDGSKSLLGAQQTTREDAVATAAKLAHKLLDEGGRALLENIQS